jgi:hypothetical protein
MQLLKGVFLKGCPQTDGDTIGRLFHLTFPHSSKISVRILDHSLNFEKDHAK